MTPTLWSISYSPWSDQARWALDHCGIEYRRRAYQPLLGEPALRLKLRRFTGPVSVPILDLGDEVLADSFDIARWADGHRAEGVPTLFPNPDLQRVERYAALAQDALSAGRALGLRRLLDDDAALDELVPRNLRFLGGVATKISAAGVRRTLRKYADVTPHELDRTLTDALGTLRRDLETHDDSYLLGATVSYADITMAQTLAFVLPPSTHLRLADASRRAYTHPQLAAQYGDLVRWRDALYATRGPQRSARAA
jgi:glutathione S-transferase